MVKIFEYSDEVRGEYTSKVVKDLWGKHTTSRKLKATIKGEKLLFKSTRLKGLLNHGCEITKFPAISRRYFEGFMHRVSDERRKGDIDVKYATILECTKVIGNSSFGRTVVDKSEQPICSCIFCLITFKVNVTSYTLSYFSAS